MRRPSDSLSFRCGATSKNRVALAPLTNQQSHDDGSLSDEERRWLVRRAAGGFGLVTTCAAHVSAEGKGFDGQLGVFDDRLLPGLGELGGAIARAGALGVVQLYHGGVRCPTRLTGKQPISASAFVEEREGFEPPRAATEEEIARVVDDFVGAALRAQRAGFAGVELHAAHGYLLSQFLSSTMNTRGDAWGGSLEGRARLVRTIAQRTRSEAGPGFLIGVRLSPEDYGFARGIDLDETIEVARWLASDGVDFVHLSLWDAKLSTKKRPSEHALPLFRDAVPQEVRLVAAGQIWTRDDAQRLLDLGADFLALGRAAILNPDWPIAIEDPSWEPRRGPLSPEALHELDVSPGFVAYLRRFKGLVA